MPDVKIWVCLLPCVFSSGSEKKVLQDLSYVDSVCDTKESLSLIFRNKFPAEVTDRKVNLIFHLGGEVALTVLLAKRLKSKLFAYVEHPISYQVSFEKVFFSGLNN